MKLLCQLVVVIMALLASVAAHGGTITFETAAGQGTKFIVQLPLAANQTE